MRTAQSSKITDIKGTICCPYCGKTKVIVFPGASGKASIPCANCNRFYIIDMTTIRAECGVTLKSELL